jgi:hypothetical protein
LEQAGCAKDGRNLPAKKQRNRLRTAICRERDVKATMKSLIDYSTEGYYATLFSLSFRPQLNITPSGLNVSLSWPANVGGFDYTGFTLQSTTNLVSPAVWSTNSPAPVVADGQNTVTTPISGTGKFYRLSQ